MFRWRRFRPLLPLVVIALVALAPIPASAQTKRDVERADEERERAYQELVDVNAELEEALEEEEAIYARLANLNWRIDQLGGAIGEYDAESTTLAETARDLVVEAYVNGGSDLIAAAFGSSSIQDLLTSQVLIDKATTYDLAAIDRLAAVSREMDRLRLELNETEREVEELHDAQVAVVARISELQQKASRLYAEAQAKYKDVVARFEEAQRRAAAAAAARKRGAAAGLPVKVTNGVACPIAGSSWFVDSWGAARSGGRSHKGTDMLAGYGTPLVAMYSGTVRVGSHSLGGRQVYLYGDNGLTYYYAHMADWASGLSTGQRVDRGQRLGSVGDSGNARGTPHLHLGIAVQGGSWVNPYPTVRAVC
jgi:murein DD-endopeptidase MepM/ murein hydrolase activator NlpD